MANSGSDAATIGRRLGSALITQGDSECMLGRGNVPGDTLGTLVPLTSASSGSGWRDIVHHDKQRHLR